VLIGPATTAPSDLVFPYFAASISATLRQISYAADPAQWFFPGPLYPGQAVRCLVGQVLDMSGRVLSSKVDNDFYTGIFFPPNNGSATTSNSINRLAGYVQVVTGIGYCIYPCPSCQPTILQDVNGVYEMNRGANSYLDLSTTSPKPPYVTGGIITGANITIYFNTTAQYTRLNLVQFNSYFYGLSPPSPPDPFEGGFGPFVDLSTNPIIEVLSSPTQVNNYYSVCNIGTQDNPLGIVTYDYSAFPLFTGIADLNLVILDITQPSLPETLVGRKLAFILPGSFPIYQYGFYCMNLIMNLLDGLGKRTVLQSCFQVGRVSATVTQLTSYFDNAPPANPYPSYRFAYAGYGSYVNMPIYLNIPPFLVLPNPATNFDPRIQLLRFSPNLFDQEQLVNFDGTAVDVYDNSMGYFNIGSFYTILQSTSNTTVYYRPNSIYNQYYNDYPVISYNGAAYASTEVVMVSFQVIYPPQFPSYYQNYYIGPYTDYNCSNPVVMNLLSNPQLAVNITFTPPICPLDLTGTYMHAYGGFCAPVWNPILASVYGNNAPLASPCTYYMSYYNVQDPNNAIFLYGTQNGFLSALAANIPIMAEATDIMGNVGRYYFTIVSDEAPNSTMIAFLPPQPVCNSSNISYVNETLVTQQSVVYQFVVSGITDIVVNKNGTNVTINAIYGWQPLNVLALAQYNPNSPFFDLPQYCDLFNNMTAEEIYIECYNRSAVVKPWCAGCTQLPISYPNTDGTVLVATEESWWEAYVWRPTTEVNPATGRQWYCLFTNSTLVTVPAPMYFQATQLRRILVNETQCPGSACLVVQLNVFVDPAYSSRYLSSVQIEPNPAFNSLRFASAASPPAIDQNSYGVSLGTDYVITLTLDDIFCPVTQVYTPSITGPFIQVVRTTHSVCNAPSGTAMFYAVYTNPTLPLGSAYTATVCMYWPNYVTPFFLFHLPINSNNPTALPFSPDFFVSQNITRFYDVSAGLQTVVLYDACVGAINCPDVTKPADCASMINQNTLQVSPPTLNFQIFQFTVDQFNAPGGGLVVSQDNITLAQCFGDQYDLKYSVFDDLGEPNQVYGPYDWQLFTPFTNEVIAQAADMCHFVTDPLTGKTTITGGVPLNDPLPVINFKVYLFDIVTFIPTGTDFGFRAPGNYTLIVRNCAAGCVQTSIVYIDMVNPFDIILNGINSTCAYTKGSIIRQIMSATPYQPGQLYDSAYEPNPYDPNFIVTALYETYWLTPFNPTTYVRMRLPTMNLPGFYSLKVCDANGCCAVRNVTVGSPPPLSITLIGVKAACQSATTATVQFAAEGGEGPPYYTLQNLTLVQAGQNITFEFVAAFNQTACFSVMDSVGCMYPTEICYSIPEPGPVPVNTTVIDSCPYTATGSATAFSLLGSGYTCQWRSSTVNLPAAQTCTVTNIPANTELQVVVTNIIGCIGQAFVNVGSRPPLFVNQIFRSTIGGLGSVPCIEYANLTVSGGVYGPNYTISLVQDTTGAVLRYYNNYTIYLTNMCRGIQYVIAVRDGDGQCLQTFISNDPQFDFGGGGNNETLIIPLGLPPFQNTESGEFGSNFGPTPTPIPKQEQFYVANRAAFIIFVIIMGTVFLFAICYIIARSRKRQSFVRFEDEQPVASRHYRPVSDQPYRYNQNYNNNINSQWKKRF
jgi:hypothetical protein